MLTDIHKAILALVLVPFAATAASPKTVKEAPVPYDADLFRKDAEVISGAAEFLYWTVQENGVDYAQKMKQSAPLLAPYLAIGEVKSATYNLDPGFRLGVSYYNAPKYWEARGQYTHLISKGKNRVGKPESATEYLTGTWPQIVTNPLIHAHSSIEFNYNLFDFSVSRMFNPNPHLRVRMVASIGAVWIKQDWKVDYYDTTLQSTAIRNRWHYTGGGMRMGITGDWFWGNDIYLTGLSSLGVYMGSYENSSKQTVSTQTLALRHSEFHDTRPAFTAQFILGPSWQKNFCNCRVELFAGYELNAWMNLQEIHRSSTGTSAFDAKETWINTGVIAMQGLTTRLTVDF
ncbi:MAG: hypothetical protein HW387_1624 [Parachlamydiales bacterium]|nr:hypothetical protein [Parachlamydiales bacterium]